MSRLCNNKNKKYTCKYYGTKDSSCCSEKGDTITNILYKINHLKLYLYMRIAMLLVDST